MTTVSEFQEVMKRTYFHKDKNRGVHATLVWMTSEVGELLDAFMTGDRSQIEVEAADVFAWLCSACNLVDVDLERASFSRYGNGCPKCGRSRCVCKDPETKRR